MMRRLLLPLAAMMALALLAAPDPALAENGGEAQCSGCSSTDAHGNMRGGDRDRFGNRLPGMPAMRVTPRDQRHGNTNYLFDTVVVPGSMRNRNDFMRNQGSFGDAMSNACGCTRGGSYSQGKTGTEMGYFAAPDAPIEIPTVYWRGHEYLFPPVASYSWDEFRDMLGIN